MLIRGRETLTKLSREAPEPRFFFKAGKIKGLDPIPVELRWCVNKAHGTGSVGKKGYLETTVV